MSKEVTPRFAKAARPGAWAWLYKRFYGLFESLGGINVKDADKMPGPGKKVLSGNHDTLMDPWVTGVIDPEAIYSLGKDELGTWRYLWLGKLVMAPFMNTKLITRTGRDIEILDGMADFMIENDVAAQSYVYGTRRPEKKGAMPKTGVAHLAIKSSIEDSPTAIVPLGHSTSIWHPGRPIQVVVGEPIYAPDDGKSLKGVALRNARRDLTDELVASIDLLKQRAIENDEAGRGIAGEIRWNFASKEPVIDKS